jgi:hypothetical protein
VKRESYSRRHVKKSLLTYVLINNAKFRKVDCNFSSIVLACAANAEETSRTELKKADLTGTNMEVIISIVEAKPCTAARF